MTTLQKILLFFLFVMIYIGFFATIAVIGDIERIHKDYKSKFKVGQLVRVDGIKTSVCSDIGTISEIDVENKTYRVRLNKVEGFVCPITELEGEEIFFRRIN